MDERGYMVCEEVWVEKEVEKEMPPSPIRQPPKPLVSKPALAPKASKGIATLVMDGDDSDDEDAQKKGKAKAKAKAKTEGRPWSA